MSAAIDGAFALELGVTRGRDDKWTLRVLEREP